mmetsp:Transcript_28388/g.57663  ORF Transcript_28388/g.57663 Transcript_28388/m.57663 type:complete len:282 (+) Transcript_28388:121-966(+)
MQWCAAALTPLSSSRSTVTPAKVCESPVSVSKLASACSASSNSNLLRSSASAATCTSSCDPKPSTSKSTLTPAASSIRRRIVSLLPVTITSLAAFPGSSIAICVLNTPSPASNAESVIPSSVVETLSVGSPEHVTPLSLLVKPASHMQVKLPAVLVQLALSWQLSRSVSHSSTSAHVGPSPAKPWRHTHSNAPSVLIHSAEAAQLWLPSVHSSASGPSGIERRLWKRSSGSMQCLMALRRWNLASLSYRRALSAATRRSGTLPVPACQNMSWVSPPSACVS